MNTAYNLTFTNLTISQQPSLIKRLSELLSILSFPTTPFQPLLSNISFPTSPFLPLLSNHYFPTSPFQPLLSYHSFPTSPFQHLLSNLSFQTSPFQPLLSNHSLPTTPFQPLLSNLSFPTTPFQPLLSDLSSDSSSNRIPLTTFTHYPDSDVGVFSGHDSAAQCSQDLFASQVVVEFSSSTPAALVDWLKEVLTASRCKGGAQCLVVEVQRPSSEKVTFTFYTRSRCKGGAPCRGAKMQIRKDSPHYVSA